jgi:hypothetical protein
MGLVGRYMSMRYVYPISLILDPCEVDQYMDVVNGRSNRRTIRGNHVLYREPIQGQR